MSPYKLIVTYHTTVFGRETVQVCRVGTGGQLRFLAGVLSQYQGFKCAEGWHKVGSRWVTEGRWDSVAQRFVRRGAAA